MPGTLDFIALNLPFGEWATFVRTFVINRVDLAVEVYECEALASAWIAITLLTGILDFLATSTNLLMAQILR